MKKRITLFFCFIMILSVAKAQLSTETPLEKADTIVLLGGKNLIVYIKNVSSTQITYKKPSQEELLNIERKNVQRIIYQNGKKEIFNPPVFQMVKEGDWKTVIVTDNISDVEGLYPQGSVEGRSSSESRNAKSAKKSATIKLQKKAANMGASYVYVTKRESKGGYGEVPSYVIEGTAYGFKPKEEKKADQKSGNNKK